MNPRRHLYGLQNALSFLTCLVSARTENADMADSLLYFFPAGLILAAGCLCTACGAGLLLADRLPEQTLYLILALIYLLTELFCTRALHWDGLADLGDALGGRSDRFWEILHDSRLGTFGALTLISVFLGQWLTISAHMAASHLLLLLMAPAWARLAPFLLIRSMPPHTSSRLGAFFSDCCLKRPLIVRSAGLTMLLCPLLSALLYRSPGSILLLLSEYLLIRRLRAVAEEKGGVNGDFLGAAIELSQLNFLLCTL